VARGPNPGPAIRPADLDAGARAVLARLDEHGHEAALVGGCVRDLLLGSTPADWDVATDATPEVVTALFPGSTWENPFGTVTVRPGPDRTAVEVTTYRAESGYRDHRRPERVRWGGSLEDDLARRDFTINAIAWLPPRAGEAEGRFVDPHGGRDDLRDRILRAVGDPDRRFAEDALRLLRAVRFALRFDLRLEPETEAAIRRNAGLAAELSGERVRDELLRMLGPGGSGSAPPSAALALLTELEILPVILPELAALRGVPQAKALPGDAFDHSLRAVDALPPDDPLLRLVGALHDVGKATTLADGHFIGHETLGATMVEAILRRLRFSKVEVSRGEHLVRMHMFEYRPDWTDAAVRRFIRRVGARRLPDLFALRRADNAASGVLEPDHGGLDELRARVGAELASHPLSPRQLAVRGDDLTASLGIAPGPVIGRLLHRLMEAVLDDPLLNDRATLLGMARSWLPDESVVRPGTTGARSGGRRRGSSSTHG
jgi:tRNA nucleotidyltransferase (CCA-adding enzyme)